MKVPLAHLRKKGHIITSYLDDLLLQGDSYEECLENIKDTCELLDRLGFTINKDRSVFSPIQNIDFLDFNIDSLSLTVRPTKKKDPWLLLNYAKIL